MKGTARKRKLGLGGKSKGNETPPQFIISLTIDKEVQAKSFEDLTRLMIFQVG